MKKSKPKQWIEDIPEEDDDPFEIDINLPQLPQLNKQKSIKVKKLKIDGDPKGNDIHSKKHSKRRPYN